MREKLLMLKVFIAQLNENCGAIKLLNRSLVKFSFTFFFLIFLA